MNNPGAAELLGTAVLHLAAKPGFSLKRKYLESKGLWQTNAPFDNATMPPEDAQLEATRGVARFNATFLELQGRRPAQGARKKELKVGRKHAGAQQAGHRGRQGGREAEGGATSEAPG